MYGVMEMIDANFIRDRITELRLEKKVSEYEVSLAIGRCRNYIQGISSGKSLPSMQAFLDICEYFEIDALTFFDTGYENPQKAQIVIDEIKKLSKDDFDLFVELLKRYNKKSD